jgi:hypothetical protein
MSGNQQDSSVVKKETLIIDFDNFIPEVSFDLEKIVLEGLYADELSAHRARKTWARILESSFLLDLEYDFKVVVDRENEPYYSVRCDFNSACGRYAFWRLTHNQAPEIQYILRTAHIPQSKLFKYQEEHEEAKFLIAPQKYTLLKKLKKYLMSRWAVQ